MGEYQAESGAGGTAVGHRRGRIAAVAARAVPGLLVAAVGPAVCFIVGRHLWGLAGAVGLALSWNVVAQAARLLAGQPWSGILLLNLVGLVLRGSLALGLNSARMFFIAPAVVTAISGVVYAGSAFTSTPLAARMLSEIVPESVIDPAALRWRSLLRRGSIIYGGEQVLVALVSILLVVRVAPTTYAAVHPVVSWAVLMIVMAGAAPLLRSCWRRAAPATPGLALEP